VSQVDIIPGALQAVQVSRVDNDVNDWEKYTGQGLDEAMRSAEAEEIKQEVFYISYTTFQMTKGTVGKEYLF